MWAHRAVFYAQSARAAGTRGSDRQRGSAAAQAAENRSRHWDDCALINDTDDAQLAISTDMLVEGRHFFSNVDPRALGHKALAVNLSDLAAMGAAPRAFTLALALPEARED